MPYKSCLLAVAVALAIGCVVTPNASAADVQADVSTRETVVGLPTILRIRINNAVEHSEPEFPEVDGLLIESVGAPTKHRSVSLINGRKTESSVVTYAFRITPQREGTFTIPPIKVTADRVTGITKAVRIIATKGETDDLLFVEIEGKEQEIFVGEPLDLTLKIWIRPYQDQQLRVKLGEGDMWNRVTTQSNWGSFQQVVEDLDRERKRPGGRSVLKKDSTGIEREYLLYEIDVTVYPDRPGQIDGGDVRIVVDYPTRLGRSPSPFSLLDDDDFFGGNDFFRGRGLFDDDVFSGFAAGLIVTDSKPIVGEAAVEPIRVKPVPTLGRPDDYRGAVGRYSIITEAAPTEVKVGEPITLHIGIDGNGPMDVVRAPPIESQSDLVRDFKVPDEPLAGFVDRSRKVFTTTIRPLRDDVNEIPGIQFSYFDPEREQYVTTASDPISITVEKADVLALDAIVGARRSTTSRPESMAEPEPTRSSPQWPLFSGDAVLASVPRATLFPRALVTMLFAPPVLAMALILVGYRRNIIRWVPARSQLRRRLQTAETAGEVAKALEHFLASRFHLSDSRLTRDQTIGRLRASGLFELAVRTDRFYVACEKQMQLPSDDQSLRKRKEEAMQIADEVGSFKWRSTSPGRFRRFSTTATLWVVIVLSSGPSLAFADASVVSLSRQQQRVLLTEALELDRSVEGEQLQSNLRRSAEKLQLLVDSGIKNDRLYFNLASTYHRAQQLGRAIAYYRRALRIDPGNSLYRSHLVRAQGDLGADLSDDQTGVAAVERWNDQLLQLVSPRVVVGIMVSAWGAFWVVIALRVFRFRFHWKSAASATLALALLCGCSYLVGVSQFVTDDSGVLIQPRVMIRDGDGEQFEVVSELKSAEGRLVRVLDGRGDWLRIELPSGRNGWIEADAAIEI